MPGVQRKRVIYTARIDRRRSSKTSGDGNITGKAQGTRFARLKYLAEKEIDRNAALEWKRLNISIIWVIINSHGVTW